MTSRPYNLRELREIAEKAIRKHGYTLEEGTAYLRGYLDATAASPPPRNQ